jgi:starch synthase
MRILAVASEIYPLVKTGGLADVAGALPAALGHSGLQVTTLVPGYPAVAKALDGRTSVLKVENLFGGRAEIVSGKAQGLDLLMLDAPHLYERSGNPYLGPDGKDWPDNAARYAALSQMAATLARGRSFDAVHLHDWQAALTAAYLKYQGGPPCVVTIHNLAFQGNFPASVFPGLGLPEQAFSFDGLEYYGGVSFLKGGIALADAITTVSPTYAREIQTPQDGMGLDGLLRHRANALHGILNGIDLEVWNPAADKSLAKTFSAKAIADRLDNKRAVERRFELDHGDGPLFCIISRLTGQKGIDIVAASADRLVEMGARLAILGSGEAALEAALRAATARHKGRIGMTVHYDEPLSHLMQGGADCILIPSRFEPCGLTQLYGLHYGCVPLVSRVGGLADTVIDANEAALAAGTATGVVFAPVSQTAFEQALGRTIALYNDPPTWRKLQVSGMNAETGWARSAARYATLFRSLKGKQ